MLINLKVIRKNEIATIAPSKLEKGTTHFLTPPIVFPRSDGEPGYEIFSGHEQLANAQTTKISVILLDTDRLGTVSLKTLPFLSERWEKEPPMQKWDFAKEEEYLKHALVDDQDKLDFPSASIVRVSKIEEPLIHYAGAEDLKEMQAAFESIGQTPLYPVILQRVGEEKYRILKGHDVVYLCKLCDITLSRIPAYIFSEFSEFEKYADLDEHGNLFEPVSTEQSGGPVSTEQSGGPVSTEQSVEPVSTEQSVEPVSTEHEPEHEPVEVLIVRELETVHRPKSQSRAGLKKYLCDLLTHLFSLKSLAPEMRGIKILTEGTIMTEDQTEAGIQSYIRRYDVQNFKAKGIQIDGVTFQKWCVVLDGTSYRHVGGKVGEAYDGIFSFVSTLLETMTPELVTHLASDMVSESSALVPTMSEDQDDRVIPDKVSAQMYSDVLEENERLRSENELLQTKVETLTTENEKLVSTILDIRMHDLSTKKLALTVDGECSVMPVLLPLQRFLPPPCALPSPRAINTALILFRLPTANGAVKSEGGHRLLPIPRRGNQPPPRALPPPRAINTGATGAVKSEGGHKPLPIPRDNSYFNPDATSRNPEHPTIETRAVEFKGVAVPHPQPLSSDEPLHIQKIECVDVGGGHSDIDDKRSIGMSKIANLCGDGYLTPVEEYLRVKGMKDDTPKNGRMQFGILHEAVILQTFEALTGTKLHGHQQLYTDTELRCHCHVDAVLTTDSGVEPVDAKFTSEFNLTRMDEYGERIFGDSGSDIFPAAYNWQLQGQMMLTGAKRAHLAVQFGNADFRVYSVKASAIMQSHIKASLKEFWSCVDTEQCPECINTKDVRLKYPARAGADSQVNLSDVAVAAVGKRQRLKAIEKICQREIESVRTVVENEIGPNKMGLLPNGDCIRFAKNNRPIYPTNNVYTELSESQFASIVSILDDADANTMIDQLVG